MKRIVVKVGSNVLTRKDGKLDVTRMSALVDQIAWLRQHDHEVILVSSGAMASGRGEIKVDHLLDSVEQRQLFSAVGQVKLVGLYYDLFREFDIHIGQVLTMKENFEPGEQYQNQQACMKVMLENDVLPIVNENDTVSVTELMFTDNDELSGLIASMLNAHCLIILSNIDGIYTGSPSDPASHLITQVKGGDDLSPYIQTERSGFGRGGMLTKCNIARRVADEGIKVIIANGKRDGVLTQLLLRPQEVPHTEFMPAAAPTSGIKKWLAHSQSFAKGQLHINAKAAEALHGSQAVSLLMVGVTGVEGDFEEGDIVSITGPQGEHLGIGRTAYSSAEARAAMGKHDVKPAIHYDYLCID